MKDHLKKKKKIEQSNIVFSFFLSMIEKILLIIKYLKILEIGSYSVQDQNSRINLEFYSNAIKISF